MFTLSRAVVADNRQTLFVAAEAALASMIVFGTGLALAVTIGFF